MPKCIYCGFITDTERKYYNHLGRCRSRGGYVKAACGAGGIINDIDEQGRELHMAVQDPLAKAVTKAYRDSDLFKLEKLFAEESRWKRKVTIATNKLSEVREQINKLSREMATPKPETKPAE